MLLHFRGTSEANEQLAEFPPRGWNSYDSFSWIVDENTYMQNAEILAEKLLPHGYEFAVIDYLWYRKYVHGAYTDSYGFDNIDEWGRPFPDLQRFPSSRIDKGFSQLANKVHGMGLKFGIHLMKGISLQAVNGNTPILDIKTVMFSFLQMELDNNYSHFGSYAFPPLFETASIFLLILC